MFIVSYACKKWHWVSLYFNPTVGISRSCIHEIWIHSFKIGAEKSTCLPINFIGVPKVDSMFILYYSTINEAKTNLKNPLDLIQFNISEQQTVFGFLKLDLFPVLQKYKLFESSWTKDIFCHIKKGVWTFGFELTYSCCPDITKYLLWSDMTKRTFRRRKKK